MLLLLLLANLEWSRPGERPGSAIGGGDKCALSEAAQSASAAVTYVTTMVVTGMRNSGSFGLSRA